MPRPRAKKLTGLTAELLGMSWENENALRMFLRRRKTSAKELGAEVVRGEDGTVRLAGEPVVEAAAPSEADFDRFADQVDALLDGQGEDSVDDAVARRFFERGVTARETVERIIADRAAALAEASAPQVVKETKAAQAVAIDRDSAPEVPAFLQRPVAPEPGRFLVQVGGAMTRDAAEMWAGQVVKLLGQDAVVIDGAGEVVRTFHAKVAKKKAAAPRKAAAPPAQRGPKKKDHWPAIEKLLARPGGVTVDEVQAILGWQTPPGLWFFRKWAEEAGRASDLVDHGNVDGKRAFSLSPPSRR